MHKKIQNHKCTHTLYINDWKIKISSILFNLASVKFLRHIFFFLFNTTHTHTLIGKVVTLHIVLYVFLVSLSWNTLHALHSYCTGAKTTEHFIVWCAIVHPTTQFLVSSFLFPSFLCKIHPFHGQPVKPKGVTLSDFWKSSCYLSQDCFSSLWATNHKQ